MLRYLYPIAIGLFGAGIIHIVVVFLVPEFSQRDAWSRLAMKADLYAVTSLAPGQDGVAIAHSADPLMPVVACRFDLADGVVQVRAPGVVPFWSVSVYNRGGENIYSFNDRTAEDGRLDFAVVTPDQMIEVRKDLPEDLRKSVFVESQSEEGIVVVRAFSPDTSWDAIVNAFLSGTSCTLR